MFHLILARGAKNYLLEVLIESVMNVVDSLAHRLKPGVRYSGKILDAHKAIYEALRKKDAESARRLMRAHLVDVRSRFLSLALKSEGEASPLIRTEEGRRANARGSTSRKRNNNGGRG